VSRAFIAIVAVALALTVLFFAVLGSVFPMFIVGLAQLPGQWWDRIGFVPERRQLERELKEQTASNEKALVDLRKARETLAATQAQVAALRVEATTSKKRVEDIQQALGVLAKQTTALQAQVDQDMARIAELDAANSKVSSKPVPRITSRQQAIDALRGMGYTGVK